MKDTLGRIFSFLDSDKVEASSYQVVGQHPGHEVRTFSELTDKVAQLNFYNPNLNLYFRGQTTDHKMHRGRGKGRTALLPGAFRQDRAPSRAASSEFLTRILPKMTKDLMGELGHLDSWKSKPYRLLAKSMRHFNETQWAVLQHYDCPTPLLDVTQSMQVACWFATHVYPTDAASNEGYLYVLGLPSIHGHISFFPNDSIVMVKLQSACPPEAKRPHNQEGYLVGSIPHDPQPYTYHPRDVAQRLAAKFRIRDPAAFWRSVGNSWITRSALLPRASAHSG